MYYALWHVHFPCHNRDGLCSKSGKGLALGFHSHLSLESHHDAMQDCLQMELLEQSACASQPTFPHGVEQIDAPLIQRQVLLRSEGSGTPLVYAASWWNAGVADSYMRDRSQPIWSNLSKGHVELYREIQQVTTQSRPRQHTLPLWCGAYID